MKNLAKRAGAETTVVRNNHTRMWTFATENHVAALLALKHKTDSFKGLPKILAGKVRRELHLPSAGSQLDVFARVFLRNRVTHSQTIFNVKIDGFLDIAHRFFPCVALRNAAGEHRNRNDKSAVWFTLKNHCVFHVAL